MNIPNLLSIFRLVVTVFFVLAVNKDQLTLALYLFIIQGVSDLLDGFLARVMGKKTALGAFLDPVADKTMLVSAYIVLCIHNVLPLWITAVVLGRDLVLSIGFLALRKVGIRFRLSPSIWGKATTGFQILTVVYVLWSGTRAYGAYFFWTTASFTIVSGLHYVSVGLRMLGRERALTEQ
jgi:cardiolipin synthase (CMP-forming)